MSNQERGERVEFSFCKYGSDAELVKQYARLEQKHTGLNSYANCAMHAIKERCRREYPALFERYCRDFVEPPKSPKSTQ